MELKSIFLAVLLVGEVGARAECSGSPFCCFEWEFMNHDIVQESVYEYMCNAEKCSIEGIEERRQRENENELSTPITNFENIWECCYGKAKIMKIQGVSMPIKKRWTEVPRL